MGSIKVYDAKQEKWFPYVPDYDEWYQLFKDLRDGYVQPDHMGRYVIGTGKRNRKLKEMEAREKEAREKEIALSKLQILHHRNGWQNQKLNVNKMRRNRQLRWVVNRCLRRTKHLWTGICSDIKRRTANKCMICSSVIQSRYVLRINLR